MPLKAKKKKPCPLQVISRKNDHSPDTENRGSGRTEQVYRSESRVQASLRRYGRAPEPGAARARTAPSTRAEAGRPRLPVKSVLSAGAIARARSSNDCWKAPRWGWPRPAGCGCGGATTKTRALA